MDWDPPRPTETWVLDKIFDRTDGWNYSAGDVPIRRVIHLADGTPNYEVTVDGIAIYTRELHRWKEGIERNVSAGRLVAVVQFTGITIHDPQKLLVATYETSGSPAFGISPQGQPSLHTGFPIAPGFPVDLARRQLMVCMGLLAAESRELLTAWNQNPVTPQRTVDWTRYEGAASTAATFLRSLLGF
ncbi:hypothetical protein ABZ876_31060 [Streptomyces sp. NPDC046931]|uniref:hypothetical protein n=1 Tax=Streptomyces sp. NPDC046931 TaxID=3154806 RepID=UPI003409683E